MKRLIILFFILMALAQWIIPSQMLWKHHIVLEKGHAFKFKTAPVDPTDYFKGKYVSLFFDERSFPVDSSFALQREEPVYINIGTDPAGYAKIKGVSATKNFPGSDYVKATVSYVGYDDSLKTSILHIDFPFEKFYMEETKAPMTEQKFRDAQKLKADSYALVNIFNGDGAVKELSINNEKIK